MRGLISIGKGRRTRFIHMLSSEGNRDGHWKQANYRHRWQLHSEGLRAACRSGMKRADRQASRGELWLVKKAEDRPMTTGMASPTHAPG